MHDYNYRFAEYVSDTGKSVTLDLHNIVAIVGNEVILNHNIRITLRKEDAFNLSMVLLDMDKDYMNNR